MSYSIESTTLFGKQLKKLAKKYPSLKIEFARLIDSLTEKPEQGVPLGKHCYKVRIAIAAKGKGKSGGGRVITYVQVINEKIYLLDIYDKSEQEDIKDEDLDELVKLIS